MLWAENTPMRCATRRLPSAAAASGRATDLAAYVELADGVLLTGSPANVHPMAFWSGGAQSGTAA